MTKENLEILEFENKTTKGGKEYTRFKTSEGWMSCFDKTSIKQLKEFVGKSACVELVKSGDFKNIKNCYGKAEEIEDEDKAEVEVEQMNKKVKPVFNQNSMYVSYAKDLFIAMFEKNTENNVNCETTMKTAIELITQAKDAFN